MGCIVKWNDSDNTWDCPCHGSIFGVDGEPLNAPAVSPLQPVDMPPTHAEEQKSSLQHS